MDTVAGQAGCCDGTFMDTAYCDGKLLGTVLDITGCCKGVLLDTGDIT